MVVGFRQSDEFSFGLQPAVREMEGPVTSTRSEKQKQDVRNYVSKFVRKSKSKVRNLFRT